MLLNRMSFNLNHLNQRKFLNSFRDTVNPLWLCNVEAETTSTISCNALYFLNKGQNYLKASVVLAVLY